MGRARSFTEAQITRALRAARRVDPKAIVEVTRDGRLLILPAQPDTVAQALTEVDEWFAKNDEG